MLRSITIASSREILQGSIAKIQDADINVTIQPVALNVAPFYIPGLLCNPQSNITFHSSSPDGWDSSVEWLVYNQYGCIITSFCKNHHNPGLGPVTTDIGPGDIFDLIPGASGNLYIVVNVHCGPNRSGGIQQSSSGTMFMR